jgi:hypothetical protein
MPPKLKLLQRQNAALKRQLSKQSQLARSRGQVASTRGRQNKTLTAAAAARAQADATIGGRIGNKTAKYVNKAAEIPKAVHTSMSANNKSGYKQLGYGVGGAALGAGAIAAGSAWSDHKRSQRGY